MLPYEIKYLRGLNSLPVPVYLKNSDGLTLNSQALWQIRHRPSLPSQLYIDSRSRRGVSTKVSRWHELHRALWQVQGTCLLRDKCAGKKSGGTQIQFFCSCNHGLTTWTEKSCALLRETTAPWASVPFATLILANRAERDQEATNITGRLWDPEDICEFGTVKQHWE